MHILLTRPIEDCSEMILKFQSLGHRVSHLPLLKIKKLNYENINFSDYKGIIFTSSNSVKFLITEKIDKNLKCFCVGSATEKKARNMLINLCKEKGYKAIFPPSELCGDNAAMIAMAGLEKFKLKKFDKLDYPAKPRWPLDENAAYLKGAGVKLF